jgi:hypothetical protein
MARTLPATSREDAMAKGQMRSNKEKKKPKAEHNKEKKKGGATPSPFAAGQQSQPGHVAFGKKA